MKIIEIKTLRGPNYWSNYRKKLIVMKLDLEELEELPTNKIAGFSERLKAMFPTMLSHRHHSTPSPRGGVRTRAECFRIASGRPGSAALTSWNHCSLGPYIDVP